MKSIRERFSNLKYRLQNLISQSSERKAMKTLEEEENFNRRGEPPRAKPPERTESETQRDVSAI